MNSTSDISVYVCFIYSMSLKPDKGGMDVVEIASSDDEEGVGMRRSNDQQVQTHKVGQQSIERIPPSEKPLSRSFWKAGGYVITPTKLTPAPGFISSIFKPISLSYVVCFDH